MTFKEMTRTGLHSHKALCQSGGRKRDSRQPLSPLFCVSTLVLTHRMSSKSLLAPAWNAGWTPYQCSRPKLWTPLVFVLPHLQCPRRSAFSRCVHAPKDHSFSSSKMDFHAGKNLQAQYERWQPRAKYKMHLDPTMDDVKKLAVSSRRAAKVDTQSLCPLQDPYVPIACTHCTVLTCCFCGFEYAPSGILLAWRNCIQTGSLHQYCICTHLVVVTAFS